VFVVDNLKNRLREAATARAGRRYPRRVGERAVRALLYDEQTLASADRQACCRLSAIDAADRLRVRGDDRLRRKRAAPPIASSFLSSLSEADRQPALTVFRDPAPASDGQAQVLVRGFPPDRRCVFAHC
jgi:hypothetical protein